MIEFLFVYERGYAAVQVSEGAYLAVVDYVRAWEIYDGYEDNPTFLYIWN